MHAPACACAIARACAPSVACACAAQGNTTCERCTTMLPSLRRGHFSGEDFSIRLSLNALVAQDLSPCACESLEFYCLLTLSLLNYDLSGPVDARAEIVDLRSGQVLVARSFSPRSYHARSCQTCTCTQTCARTHTHTHTHMHTHTHAHAHMPSNGGGQVVSNVVKTSFDLQLQSKATSSCQCQSFSPSFLTVTIVNLYLC